MRNKNCFYNHRQGTTISTIFDEFSENFQTASDPPPYFRKTMLRFLQRNFSGCSDPTLFLYRKSATKFFGSEMIPPPLRKFSENSSNQVQVVFPNSIKSPNLLLWPFQSQSPALPRVVFLGRTFLVVQVSTVLDPANELRSIQALQYVPLA